jgi:hypothetical protein
VISKLLYCSTVWSNTIHTYDHVSNTHIWSCKQYTHMIM